MENGEYPIFVTAGDDQQKLKHITHNQYLTYCYDSLCEAKGSLVIFGFSFGAHDDHIIDAINRAAKRKAPDKLWSVYMASTPTMIEITSNKSLENFGAKCTSTTLRRQTFGVKARSDSCPFGRAQGASESRSAERSEGSLDAPEHSRRISLRTTLLNCVTTQIELSARRSATQCSRRKPPFRFEPMPTRYKPNKHARPLTKEIRYDAIDWNNWQAVISGFEQQLYWWYINPIKRLRDDTAATTALPLSR